MFEKMALCHHRKNQRRYVEMGQVSLPVKSSFSLIMNEERENI